MNDSRKLILGINMVAQIGQCCPKLWPVGAVIPNAGGCDGAQLKQSSWGKGRLQMPYGN